MRRVFHICESKYNIERSYLSEKRRERERDEEIFSISKYMELSLGEREREREREREKGKRGVYNTSPNVLRGFSVCSVCVCSNKYSKLNRINPFAKTKTNYTYTENAWNTECNQKKMQLKLFFPFWLSDRFFFWLLNKPKNPKMVRK